MLKSSSSGELLMLRFTCGCSSKIEIPVPIKRDLIEQAGMTVEKARTHYLTTFDSVVFDAQGFIICAIHRQRRLGWRTVPYAIHQRPKGLPADMTELEWEQWVLYRTEPKRERVSNEIFSEISSPGSIDLRDRRDASDLGVTTLRDMERRQKLAAGAITVEDVKRDAF